MQFGKSVKGLIFELAILRFPSILFIISLEWQDACQSRKIDFYAYFLEIYAGACLDGQFHEGYFIQDQ